MKYARVTASLTKAGSAMHTAMAGLTRGVQLRQFRDPLNPKPCQTVAFAAIDKRSSSYCPHESSIVMAS